jgi:DNA mismatch repair protein MutS
MRALAAQVLDIALTSRGEHEGEPIPMCGVPVHSAEGYLARLIKAGCRVAIAEQTETPAEEGEEARRLPRRWSRATSSASSRRAR